MGISCIDFFTDQCLQPLFRYCRITKILLIKWYHSHWHGKFEYTRVFGVTDFSCTYSLCVPTDYPDVQYLFTLAWNLFIEKFPLVLNQIPACTRYAMSLIESCCRIASPHSTTDLSINSASIPGNRTSRIAPLIGSPLRASNFYDFHSRTCHFSPFFSVYIISCHSLSLCFNKLSRYLRVRFFESDSVKNLSQQKFTN